MSFFDTVFDRVIGHEGNFQNDPRDRGNWTTGRIDQGECRGTKFGIAAMSYPTLDIKNLTREEAREIYYKDFWLPVGGDKLPNELVYQAFDASFNHGLGNCIKMVQRAIFVNDDGRFGTKSLEALRKINTHDLLMRFLAQRLRFMTNTKVWDAYGKGWARRIADNLEYAAVDTIE